jgi:hypothetical protein
MARERARERERERDRQRDRDRDRERARYESGTRSRLLAVVESANVLVLLGVDLNLFALVDEEGDHDHCA